MGWPEDDYEDEGHTCSGCGEECDCGDEFDCQDCDECWDQLD